MLSFEYKGRDRRGELVQGTLRASSMDAAAGELLAAGTTPIDIRELGAAAGRSTRKRRLFSGASRPLLRRARLQPGDLIMFSRQMYRLTKAGLPLDRALRGLEASISSEALKPVLRDICVQLAKGMSLTDSLGRHRRIFSPLYLSLVHVGENTGRLDVAFMQVARYMELELSTRKQVRTATRYPLFVISAIIVAMLVVTMYVIPTFAETFDRLDADLPWQTRFLINASDFIRDFWQYLAAALALVWWQLRRFVTTDRGRLRWDRARLRLPVVGSLLRRIALSRFSRTLAMMLQAGVPIVHSLEVISRAVGNKHIGDNVLAMREGIAQGQSLYQASVNSGLFSPLVLQMIAVGEESGNVGELLEEVADFYDAEVEYELKRLASLIEPLLIFLVAAMVLVLALGVFLPIWDLASAAR